MIRMTGHTVAFLPAGANAASRRRGGLVRNSTEPGGPWVSLEAPRRQRSPGSERLIRRARRLAMRTFSQIGGGDGVTCAVFDGSTSPKEGLKFQVDGN